MEWTGDAEESSQVDFRFTILDCSSSKHKGYEAFVMHGKLFREILFESLHCLWKILAA